VRAPPAVVIVAYRLMTERVLLALDAERARITARIRLIVKKFEARRAQSIIALI